MATAAVIAAIGCGPKPVPAKPPERASLQLDKGTLLRNGGSLDLIRKLSLSRFRYFRMLADPYEARTCEAFRDIAAALPIAVVQGDAHVEQFVVTSNTYGVEDFDHAGFGPVVVDLVRYASSLHVACSDSVWPCDPDAAVEQFLIAYRTSLMKEPISSQPAVVARLRARGPSSRGSWLAWADTLMVPLRPALDVDVRRSWPLAVVDSLSHPEWPSSAFTIVRLGSLRLGFGSALERKALIRIAGPTDAADDDVVIEAREGATPKTNDCVWRGTYGEPLVLMFTAVLGRRVPEVYGFAPLLGSLRHFWLQSWDPGYAELAISDISNQHELEELAIDAGRQLVVQFWSHFPEQLRRYQRAAHLRAFDLTRSRVIQLARELAVESNAAWEQFRR